MPPLSWSGYEASTGREPDDAEHLARALVAHRLGDALHLEAERDVVDHRPVREQPEVLEDHRHVRAAELRAAPPASRAEHVLAADLDLARRRLDQPVSAADERRLAAAREAHDDEDLAAARPRRRCRGGDGAAVLRLSSARGRSTSRVPTTRSAWRRRSSRRRCGADQRRAAESAGALQPSREPVTADRIRRTRSTARFNPGPQKRPMVLPWSSMSTLCAAGVRP